MGGGKGIDLAKARILVSNDDGILAPGLKVLERIAKHFSKDVWVVAPAAEQSAASHSLTLRRPLRVQKLGPRRFTVDGTPTDCVLVAQNKLLSDRPADILLSGINQGANLGEDISYSGTVAAAKEAAYLGLPAVAFSQCRNKDGNINWATAEHYGVEVLRRLTGFRWRGRILVNVNFPALKPDAVNGITICPQGERNAATTVNEYSDPMGRPYLWIGDFTSDKTVQRNSDLGAIAAGAVAVTPLHSGFHPQGLHGPAEGDLRVTMPSRKIRLVMQLRSAGIADTEVLSAIERIPREIFVPDSFQDQAYENRALPIGQGQTLSQPQVVAVMTQALAASRRTKLLEIGTGSGYQAAVLSRMCRRVYTIERHRDLLRDGGSAFPGAQAAQHHHPRRRRLEGLGRAGALRPHHRHGRTAGIAGKPDGSAGPRRHHGDPPGHHLARPAIIEGAPRRPGAVFRGGLGAGAFRALGGRHAEPQPTASRRGAGSALAGRKSVMTPLVEKIRAAKSRPERVKAGKGLLLIMAAGIVVSACAPNDRSYYPQRAATPMNHPAPPKRRPTPPQDYLAVAAQERGDIQSTNSKTGPITVARAPSPAVIEVQPLEPVQPPQQIEKQEAPEPAQAATTGGSYRVQKGDSLYGISRRSGVPLRQLVEANGLQSPYNLQVGQTLTLPKVSSAGRQHQVAKGETVYGISRLYGVEMSALASRNGLAAPYSISPGQQLVIPGTQVAGQEAGEPLVTAAGKTSAQSPAKQQVARAPDAAASETPSAPETAPAPRRAQSAIPKPPPLAGGKFAWPIEGKILASFGPRKDGQHNDGINILAPRGAPVRAVENGVVAYAGEELRGFGRLLLVKHANGWVSAYAHNDSLLVQRGDTVKRGQPIAKVGSSGNVARPQLHFEIRKGSRAIDPRQLLEPSKIASAG